MAVAEADPTLCHPRDGRPIPRWAHTVAHLIPLTTLPSGLWRVGNALGFDLGLREYGRPTVFDVWESVYLVVISLVIEGLALLAFGLVRPWGERAPTWFPLIGGRRVPARAVIAAAVFGTLASTAVALMFFVPEENLSGIEATDAGVVVAVVCYLPLLAWGPLLGALTYGYYRRRCRD